MRRNAKQQRIEALIWWDSLSERDQLYTIKKHLKGAEVLSGRDIEYIHQKVQRASIVV